MNELIKVLIGFFLIACAVGLIVFFIPAVFMFLFNRVAPVYGVSTVLGYWDAFFTVWFLSVLSGISSGIKFKKKVKS